MELDKYKMGIIYGIIATLLIGFQPIVANSRPEIIDSYIFAAMTCIVESLIFLPLFLLERRKLKEQIKDKIIDPKKLEKLGNEKILESYKNLHGWKNNKYLLLYIGFNFGIVQILFFWGYWLAGTINGALTQKTTVLFSILFGYVLLKERVKFIQVIFSFILFFGLILAITEGSFNLLEFNMGVIILLITACLWMLAHTLTKPILNRQETTAIQLVFIRNLLSGLILISTYFIFYPLSNLTLFLDPLNIFYFIAMGVVYGVGLFFWYKTLSSLDVSKASIMVSATPIVSAIFAVFLLGEIFTIFHLFGTIIVVGSIVIIMKYK